MFIYISPSSALHKTDEWLMFACHNQVLLCLTGELLTGERIEQLYQLSGNVIGTGKLTCWFYDSVDYAK